jgi:hypothetical protein
MSKDPTNGTASRAVGTRSFQIVVHQLPKCSQCSSHIGTAASVCGACKLPQPLTAAELMRMARLTRRHWGSGVLRELVMHPSYRPCFVVSPMQSQRDQLSLQDRAELITEMAERAELANLYDRSQAGRGLGRRAVRI